MKIPFSLTLISSSCLFFCLCFYIRCSSQALDLDDTSFFVVVDSSMKRFRELIEVN